MKYAVLLCISILAGCSSDNGLDFIPREQLSLLQAEAHLKASQEKAEPEAISVDALLQQARQYKKDDISEEAQ